jgi:hypothetical protein
LTLFYKTFITILFHRKNEKKKPENLHPHSTSFRSGHAAVFRSYRISDHKTHQPLIAYATASKNRCIACTKKKKKKKKKEEG